MVNCFIEISKSYLKRRLKELNIQRKYQDSICDGVKNIIDDALDDFIEQAIEQVIIISGQDSLEKYTKKQIDVKLILYRIEKTKLHRVVNHKLDSIKRQNGYLSLPN